MVSVIIPTLNRSDQLSKTLQSLVAQNSLADAEIIVVDNGSTDGTKSIVEQYSKQISCLNYAYNAMPGLLTGRHLGIALAKGDILSFLDDDVELNPAYIQNIVTLFSKNADVHFATGPNLPKYETIPPQWLESFWEKTSEGTFCSWLSLLDFGSTEKFIDQGFVWGLNFCCRKATAIELGGFHPDCIDTKLQKFQGDGETGLTNKAREKGYAALYSPGLKLYHIVPAGRLTASYFERRAFYQGVCNSFTELRKNKGTLSTNNGIIQKLKPCLKNYYRKLKLKLQVSSHQTQLQLLLLKLERQQKEGYLFHQRKFKKEEKVRNWVLKDNFWDFNLPQS